MKPVSWCSRSLIAVIVGLASIALSPRSIGADEIVVPTSSAMTIAPSYQAVPVTRLVDTRGDVQAAIQVPIRRLTPGIPLEVEVAGAAGIPESGVAAVDVNIAVTAVARTGFLAVYPCADGNDGTARLNYARRAGSSASAIAVQVLAQLDADGKVCIEASAPAHVIVDTSGYLVDGGPFRAVPAKRLFDTRTGEGEVEVTAAKPARATPLAIEVAGVAGVPETGASAVLLSVAAVKGTAPGFVSVFPCADGFQGTANLNHRRDDPVANSVIVPLDENGEICFYNSASVDLVVDISAWFATDAGFGALEPSRAADTRDGTGGIAIAKLTPMESSPIQLAGVGGVPDVGVEAVSLNVAVARGASSGFLAIFPCDEEWNGTASLNFQQGEPISNAALTPIASDGTACVLASAPVDVIIDVNGWLGVEPTAVDDAVTIDEDSGINQIDVLDNDLATARVTAITQPENGSVAITNGGDDIRFIPPTNFCTDGPLFDLDPETFTYTAEPGSVTATVSVTITCVDDAPVAAADAATLTEDDATTVIDVLANDTDPDLGPISISSVTQPGLGAVVNSGTDLSYTPDADACNDGSPTDDFSYTLEPGGSTATVAITITCVDDAPTAVDDSGAGFEVDEDDPPTTIDPLANDTDTDGGPLTIGSVVQPTNGTVAIVNGGGELTYAPDPAYCNDGSPTDDFTYTLVPGGSTATISTTVTCVPGLNNAPVAMQLDLSTTEDDSVSGNFIDDSGSFDPNPVDTLTVQSVDGVPITGVNQIVVLASGSRITVSPNGDFTYSGLLGTLQTLPESGAGQDAMSIVLSDGDLTDAADLVVALTGVNDAPTATPLSRTTNEDESVFQVDLLANAVEIDQGDMLAIENFTETPTSFGSFTLGGTSLFFDATIFDELEAGETQIVNFTYDVVDSQGARVETSLQLTIEGRDEI